MGVVTTRAVAQTETLVAMTASQEHTAKVEQLYRNLGQTAQQIQGRVAETDRQLRQMDGEAAEAVAGVAGRTAVSAAVRQGRKMQQENTITLSQ